MNVGENPALDNTYIGGQGDGLRLTSNGGAIRAEGMPAGAQSTAAVQAFLSPRNYNQTVTAPRTLLARSPVGVELCLPRSAVPRAPSGQQRR